MNNNKQEKLQLQNVVLNNARKKRIPLNIFLLNGVQIKCTVKSFDDYCVLIESEGKQSLIYKHAISTIVATDKSELLTTNNNK